MKLCKLLAAFGLLCAAVLSLPSHAQNYPSHAIILMVPSSPGVTADSLARLLGTKISQRWNVPVIVENKPGAGGIIGIDAVAKANPDGHTLLFAGSAISTLGTLRSKLPYDPIRSFSPVVLLGASPLALIVTNSFPAKTVREFIDHAKKQPPGSLNYASPGIGSVHHLTMEMFKQETGINMTHVPYKGSAGALNDIVAGHVQGGVIPLQTAAPLVQGGKMRMLAVLGTERAAQFPQVPTLGEAGVPKVVSAASFGVFAPAGTPPAVIAKINSEINSLLALPDVKASIAKMGVDPAGGTPEKLAVLVRDEIKMWSQVVTRAKIVAE